MSLKLVASTEAPIKTGRKPDGRFAPGNRANPQGRPHGSRNKAALAAEALLAGEAEALTRKAIELALANDTVALRLCLERLCPPRKDRPVQFDLPARDGAEDVVAAIGAVLAAVAAGTLTPGEGQALAGLIELQRKAIETADIERRLSALEQWQEGR